MHAPDTRTAAGADGPPLRPYLLALATLILLGLAFGAMAKAARRPVLGDLDLQVHNWVTRERDNWPGVTRLAFAATRIGDSEIAVPMSILVAAVLLVLGRRGIGHLKSHEAVFWLGVLIGQVLINRLTKRWFGRERPPAELRLILIEDDSFSFPSGHALYAAIFFTMLATLIVRAVPASRAGWRVAGVVLCLASALLVAASRVWLGVHYPTDVLGGLFLGVGWVIAAYLIRSGWALIRRRRPATGGRRAAEP